MTAPHPPQTLRFHGTGGTLLGLALVNALLSLVTLGIYSFWAKTRVRQFWYSETELAGDRFAYHGTGRELLIGSLKAFGVLLALYLVFLVLMTVTATPADPNAPPSGAQLAVSLMLPLAIVLLLPIAITGARRYRLSRSSWRGIRFSFRGRWQDYLQLVVKGVGLSILTLGLYLPFFQNQGRAFLVNHTRFGSLPFSYDADGKPVFVAYLKALVLTLPTLGLSWIWYAAFRHRYFWSHSAIAGARLQSTVTGGGLLGLALTNAALVVVTLGIGTPWAMTRALAYVCDHIALEGEVDWGTVHQDATLPSATGEGLAEGLDLDVDVGLGM